MTLKDPTLVTFYGGLGEIGRNMATIEVGGKIAVVDSGVFFPNPEDLGVDLIIPDWAELRKRQNDVTAVFLTHGHLDHIGAMPYLLRDFPDVVVYGTRLTIALVEAILEEWPDIDDPTLVVTEPGQVIHHEPFEVEVIRVSHSIPDGTALAFRTPDGVIVHSGDFKMDQTPVDGLPTDMAHLARLGDEKVALALVDSTNADVPGSVPTERRVGSAISAVMKDCEGLVVVASFSSHIHRVQQVLDAAMELGRKPVFVGRSMVRNMGIARELGYIEFDESKIIEMRDVKKHDPSEVVIVCTGSQGEPFSALSLMSRGDHRDIKVGTGDLIILASSLIPGNEHSVFRSINGLARRGAKVVSSRNADVHVSGHANAGDLALYHNLLEPEYVVPVHGEYRHLQAQAEIAVSTGCPEDNVLLCEDGDVVELLDGKAKKLDPIKSGRVYIDGLLTDVGPSVLKERQRLSEDGICVCVITIDVDSAKLAEDPIIFQRGVIFEEQSADVIDQVRKAVTREVEGLSRDKIRDFELLRRQATQAMGTYWRGEVGRRPMLLPIILEA